MTFMDYRFLFLVKSFDLEDAGKILLCVSVFRFDLVGSCHFHFLTVF